MNAIILAAGMGTRLRPLTNDIPKCLVRVSGIPMVERQIEFLHEAGITEIILVSGYKAEKLDYLKSKYGVGIIFNEQYDSCNNIYSLYKVLDCFGDSWVIEGDVFLEKNCFSQYIERSTYFAKWHDHYENEWGLETDVNGKLIKINIGNGKGFIMSGISYWTNDDANIVSKEIHTLLNTDNFRNLFWDHGVLNVYNSLDIQVSSFPYIHEIDTENELRTVEKMLSNNLRIQVP